MINNGKSTVLSFDQPSEFFGKRAQKLLDKSDLWGALANLRRALRKDGGNAGYILDAAEILAQMGLYERSCRLLFSLILRGDEENTPECYFALGCNFYALRMNELSRECLTTYLTLDPDGEYREDCDEMLYMLEEELADSGEYLYTTAERDADDGKYALDTGDYAQAQRLLEKALAQDPSMHYARNNLALACFCAGDTRRAVEEGEKVLEKKPEDAHGLCNMALFLNSRGQYEQAQALVRRACPTQDDDGEEQYKICLTMAELGMDQDVLAQTADLLKYSPYDERALFLHAIALCNLGAPAQAYRDVCRLALIEPDSEVFAYLHGVVTARMREEPPKKHHPISYTAPIPYRQMVKKVMRAQELMRIKDPAQAADAFCRDAQMRSDVVWCLYYSESSMLRLSLCQFLAQLKRPEITLVLYEMLVSLQLSDEVKKGVVVALTHAGEKPPYLAVISGHLTEVNVRETGNPLAGRKIPPCYERVLHDALATLAQDHDEEVMALCAQIWLRYMMDQPDPMPYLKNEDSWAAALALATLEVLGESYQIDDYAKRAHTFIYLLGRRISHLVKLYQQRPEETSTKES
jgi:tetratricopeptide (TPR) repeat protein